MEKERQVGIPTAIARQQVSSGMGRMPGKAAWARECLS